MFVLTQLFSNILLHFDEIIIINISMSGHFFFLFILKFFQKTFHEEVSRNGDSIKYLFCLNLFNMFQLIRPEGTDPGIHRPGRFNKRILSAIFIRFSNKI